MLVSIGKRKNPEDVVGLFLECHQRIRSFIRIAEEVGRRQDLSNVEVTEASARCERYFAEALPLHVTDEELSLLPRLSGVSPEMDDALTRMQAQHAEHEVLLEALLLALRAVGRSPDAQEHRRELHRIAALLKEDFEQHLTLEEQVIFSGARSFLSKAAEAEILRELRARRQPGPPK